MEHGTIIKVAEGNFPFHFWIGKAVPSMDGDQMIVEGVASTLNVDHDKERMSAEALKSMANIINTTGVPLRVEHSQQDNAVIGNVNKAWIDERNQLWIKATLDASHPASGILYKGLKDGVKMGLSVGGYVRRAVQEMVEGVGKSVNTFYDVLLDEVSVTQKPSNYDARLMAKSFAKSEGEIDALAGAFESSEFLFNSAMAQSDYLQAISKSVKETDWKDVEKGDYKLDKSNSMSEKDTEKKTTKAEEKEEDKTTKTSDTEEKKEKSSGDDSGDKTEKSSEEEKTEKSVSRAEFNQLVKMTSEGFNGLTAALGKMAKAMGDDAMDQRQPDEKKKDPEEGKTVDKSSGGDAVDQEQPKKDKIDPEAGKNVDKAKDDGTDLEGEREEKAKKGGDETYDLETVERAVKAIRSINKESKEEDKAEKSSDTEKVTKSQGKVASIDEFVIEVAEYIERLEKSMKEGGYQTNHIAKTVINSIRSNPEFRKDIGHFMAEAGPKRSVISGTPFVKMKDGRTYALTLGALGERTEKSAADAPKTFKEAWGKSFSSQKEQE